MIQEKRYVDIYDLPKDAQEAYRTFVSEFGLHCDQHYPWTVGEVGDDSVPEGYIGREKCDIIDAALRVLGLKDGDDIDLAFSW